MRCSKRIAILIGFCLICTLFPMSLAEEIVSDTIEEDIEEATTIGAEGLYAESQVFFSEEDINVEPEDYIEGDSSDDISFETEASSDNVADTAVMATTEKTDIPLSGRSFDAAVDISAGLCYFIENSDLEGSSFFGYKGWYKFITPESGTYYFTGKNITSSNMGIEVFNKYEEWVCGTAGSDFLGLYSGSFSGKMSYSTVFDKGETYYVWVHNNGGKSELTICTPSVHPVNGDWEISITPTCQPGKKSLKCAACNTVLSEKEIPPTGHVPGEWTVTKEPTLYWPGEQIQICSVCGETLNTEVIPATGIPLQSFRLDKKNITLGVGQNCPFRWIVSPSDADWEMSFESSNTQVVQLRDNSYSNGYSIIAKNTGKAVVTVTANNGEKKTITVVVKPAPSKVTLYKGGKKLNNGATLTLKKGQSLQLKAKITKGTLTTLTWKSSKPSVVKVSKTGKVKALKRGTAIITVKTINGKKATVKIKVK